MLITGLLKQRKKPYNKQLINLEGLVFIGKSPTLVLLYWPCYCFVNMADCRESATTN